MLSLFSSVHIERSGIINRRPVLVSFCSRRICCDYVRCRFAVLLRFDCSWIKFLLRFVEVDMHSHDILPFLSLSTIPPGLLLVFTVSEIVSTLKYVDFEIYHFTSGYFHIEQVYGENLDFEILEIVSSMSCCNSNTVLSTCCYFDSVDSVVEESPS